MIPSNSQNKQQALPAVVIYGGLSLLRPFRKTNISCHALAHSKSDLIRYSRKIHSFKALPPLNSDSDALIQALIDSSTKFKVKPVLYYGNDQTMRFISTHREVLSDHYRFLMPTAKLVSSCSEKNSFNELIKDIDVTYPKSIITNSRLSERDLNSFTPPFVIKPNKTSNQSVIAQITANKTQKAIVVETKKEALHVASLLENKNVPFILQEIIQGTEDNIFSYHAFNDENFQPIGYFVGRKVRTYPHFGGRSTCVTLVDDDEVVETGQFISQKLNFCGPLKLDFKRDSRSGKLYFLEANLRFTLWNHLAAECGINLPLRAYQYLCGLPIDHGNEYQTGRQWIATNDDIRSFLDINNSPTAMLQYGIQRLNSYSHVFSIQDPVPYLISLKRRLKSLRNR
ncbi:MAG: hypothetical protein KZQ73_00165 [Candidatus Thiodiazotropha sp. (ex Semelilucina semeliformis)]|nr:hypothetical protein [Candidatus Thiodiazotropha sp. (ex Semelilucina semeliformis)]